MHDIESHNDNLLWCNRTLSVMNYDQGLTRVVRLSNILQSCQIDSPTIPKKRLIFKVTQFDLCS
jgi:hypothetical protein